MSAIPHVASARAVEAGINSVIPDIKLFWHPGFKRWVVAQVQHNPGGLILPENGKLFSTSRPNKLFKIETPTGEYREPSDMDTARAIQIGRDGREAIAKGGDWLVDKIEQHEQANKDAADQRLREKVAAIAPTVRHALKKARA